MISASLRVASFESLPVLGQQFVGATQCLIGVCHLFQLQVDEGEMVIGGAELAVLLNRLRYMMLASL